MIATMFRNTQNMKKVAKKGKEQIAKLRICPALTVFCQVLVLRIEDGEGADMSTSMR